MPSADTSRNPLTVEVTRGPAVESRHAVHAAVVEADGGIVARYGEVERPVFPRSAIKAIQALPLAESGAEIRLQELAIACASHGGEPRHVATVTTWLDRLGLDDGCLECGVHLPLHEASAHALVRAGEAPRAYHHNCSGKHAGMVCTAVQAGEKAAGYVAPEHPVQRRVSAAIADMTGADLSRAPLGSDGCSIPTYAIPLTALALGIARVAAPAGLAPTRAAACRRIVQAVTTDPFLVAGTGRLCTLLMERAGGTLIAKTGAEGVFVAASVRTGRAVALKAEDGAKRAAEAAILELCRRHDLIDQATHAALVGNALPEIRSVRGRAVGRTRVS
ncbi:MAG: asparaginase [Alphaproteobacteria bacterium]|nr:asparaginase [Alphaproteobacteria bacterium]